MQEFSNAPSVEKRKEKKTPFLVWCIRSLEKSGHVCQSSFDWLPLCVCVCVCVCIPQECSTKHQSAFLAFVDSFEEQLHLISLMSDMAAHIKM